MVTWSRRNTKWLATWINTRFFDLTKWKCVKKQTKKSVKPKWRQISYQLHLKKVNCIVRCVYYLTKSTTDRPIPISTSKCFLSKRKTLTIQCLVFKITFILNLTILNFKFNIKKVKCTYTLMSIKSAVTLSSFNNLKR